MSTSAGTVLLTGANGFVASHILAGLVQRNYHIVASVRSEKKAKEILELHPEWKSYITFAYIPDITVEGAYDEIFGNQRLDYIIHNASPLNFKVKDIQEEMIRPAIEGTTVLLSAAHKQAGPTLKRFVVLGSAVAVLDSFQDISKAGKPYTENDWNPVTSEYAIQNNDILSGYNASKKLAEEAVWKYQKENDLSFDITILLPDIILGPMLQWVPGPENVNESNGFAVWNFLNGTYTSIEGLAFPFYHYVDVRDVALAHILSMTAPGASDKRILLVAGLMTPQLVANTIRDKFPNLRDRVIEGNPGQILPPGNDPTGWDTSLSHEVFGKEWKYTELEKSVADTVESLLEWEKKWAVSA